MMLKSGSKFDIKNNAGKVTPMDPQRNAKVNQNRQNGKEVTPKGCQRDAKKTTKTDRKRVLEGSKEGPQDCTLSRTRKSEILLLFTIL